MKYEDEDYEYEKRRREVEQRKRVRPDAEMTSQRRRSTSGQQTRRAASSQDSYAKRCAQSYGTSGSRNAQANGSRSTLGTDPYARKTSQGTRRAASSGTRQTSGTARRAGADPYDRSAGISAQRTGSANYYEDMSSRKRQKPAVTASTGKKNGKKQLSPKMKKKRRNRRILFTIEGILLCLVLLCLFVLSKWDLIQKASFGKKDVHVNELSSNVVESMEGYRTIAVFGQDETGYHSDVIMIININNKTKEVKLTSVLRDTYWNVPDPTTGNEDKYAKANNAYHTGGELNALKALNKNLDLQITEYVTVNWKAVSLAIDYLGGIDIDVPESMMGEINGYITETVEKTGRGSYQLEHSGYQHLDGIQTVAYCRIRHNNGGDDGRAERQRQVVGLMLERAKAVGPDVLLQVCDVVFPEVSTNLTLAEAISLASSAGDYSIIQNIAFPYHQIDALVGSASVKVPLGLAEDVAQLHLDLFGDSSYVPSETVQQISNKIESLTGYGIEDRTD